MHEGRQARARARESRPTPERFFLPAYVGPRGYLGIRVGAKRADWKEVTTRVAAAYASVTEITPRDATQAQDAVSPDLPVSL